MFRTPEEDLKRELQDSEYVKLYGASDAKAEIAITLCEARQAAKKTQKELADAMSISQPYIAKIEGGEANPTVGTIGSILAMLGYRLATNIKPLFPEPIPIKAPSVMDFALYSLRDEVGTANTTYQPQVESKEQEILVGGTVQ